MCGMLLEISSRSKIYKPMRKKVLLMINVLRFKLGKLLRPKNRNLKQDEGDIDWSLDPG